MKKQPKLLIGIIAGVAVLAVVIISIVMTAAGGSKDTYSSHLELAQRYLDELQYEQAIAEYEVAIAIDPKNQEAYLGLADVYVAMDDIEKALDVLAEGYEQTESERIVARQKELEEELAQEEEGLGEETSDGDERASDASSEELLGEPEQKEVTVCVKRTVYRSDGSVLGWGEYDAAGNKTKYTCYNLDGSVWYWDEYEYDAAGNETKYTSYNSDGSIDIWGEMEYITIP